MCVFFDSSGGGGGVTVLFLMQFLLLSIQLILFFSSPVGYLCFSICPCRYVCLVRADVFSIWFYRFQLIEVVFENFI